MAFVNYENKKGSGKKLKVHFDLPEDDDYPMTNHKHSTSVSSESSLDSDDINKDNNSIDKFDSNYGGYGSPVWSFQGGSGSVTQSPPVQSMSSPDYDPNRIPSTVFGNRPTSPLEWSVASNESLFSIHLGNNSFSREFGFATNKSGEIPATLPTVEEGYSTDGNNVDLKRHSVSSDSSDKSSNSFEGHDHKKTSHDTAGSVVVVDHKDTETPTEAGTIVLNKTPDDHGKEAKVPGEEPAQNLTSVSHRSLASDVSTRSFQFPILTADGGATSSSTVETEKQEKSENQNEQEQEKALQPPSSPKTENPPKQNGRSWCFCLSCLPCF